RRDGNGRLALLDEQGQDQVLGREVGLAHEVAVRSGSAVAARALEHAWTLSRVVEGRQVPESEGDRLGVAETNLQVLELSAQGAGGGARDVPSGRLLRTAHRGRVTVEELEQLPAEQPFVGGIPLEPLVKGRHRRGGARAPRAPRELLRLLVQGAQGELA